MSGKYFLSLHRRLAPWLILLLIVAQGLRVCIPDADGHNQHDSVIHLESLLTAAADQHESGHQSDKDLTVPVLLKLIKLFLSGGLALLCALLCVVLVRGSCPFYRPEERCLRPPRDTVFAPPLRAPPV